MFNKVERLISLRNLSPKKKEGFLKVISVFSFLVIMLGVAILIIVMSVMNGFRAELTNKILGINPHIIVKPYNTKISDNFILTLKKKYSDFNIKKSFNGEGVALSKDISRGVMVKGIDKNEKNNRKFLIKNIIKGDLKKFKDGTVILGSELALSLGINIDDNFNILSSTFIGTPFGNLPKQETFKVSAIFNSGFFEFDQNVIFLNLNDSLLLFDKNNKDLNLEIYLNDPLNADLYKSEIEMFNDEYYIYTWTDLNKSFFGALKIERNVMFVILTLIIIVAAFNIISGLTILIKNKTKEIAILKTLGLKNSSITKSFFLTGFTIGFFATIAGIIFGVTFSFYIEEIRFLVSTVFNLEIFPPDIYFLDSMPSEIDIKSIAIIFLFSILISALASFFPARMVSKMNTIKALKYE